MVDSNCKYKAKAIQYFSITKFRNKNKPLMVKGMKMLVQSCREKELAF